MWALLVLFVVYPGPLPGALALGIYTFGILGRLFAEVMEDLDHRLLEQQRVAFDYPGMAGTVLALVVVCIIVDLVSLAVRTSLR